MPTFQQLRRGNILGIVTAQGEVLSKFLIAVECHDDHFPPCHCKWRWDFDKGINWFLTENKPDGEQFSMIQNHLTRTYGIQWWDNGHHDIDHFLKNCKPKRQKRK